MDWEPHPGMLVVCVDDSQTNADNMTEIVRGNVYTFRATVEPDELFAAIFGRPLDEPGIMLVEVRRPSIDGDIGEVPFGALRFRPVDDKALDIFRTTLAPIEKVLS